MRDHDEGGAWEPNPVLCHPSERPETRADYTRGFTLGAFVGAFVGAIAMLLLVMFASCASTTRPKVARMQCTGDTCAPGDEGGSSSKAGTASDTVKLLSPCTAIWDFQIDGRMIGSGTWYFQPGSVLVQEPGVGRHLLTGTHWYTNGASTPLMDSVSAGTTYTLPCP